MDDLEKEIYEKDLEFRRIQESEKRFGDYKKRQLNEIAKAEAEIEKNVRNMEEIDKELIP